MLKNFWCWLIGHSFLQKSDFTTRPIGAGMYLDEYKLLQSPFCLRCGVRNPYFDLGSGVHAQQAPTSTRREPKASLATTDCEKHEETGQPL